MTASTRAAAIRLADKSGQCLVRMDNQHFAATSPEYQTGILYQPTDDSVFTLHRFGALFLRTFPHSAKRFRKAARKLMRAVS